MPQQQSRPFSGNNNNNRQSGYGTYQPIQNGLVGEPMEAKPRRSKKPWWVLLFLFIAIPMIYLFVFHVPGMSPAYVPVPDLIQLKSLNQSLLPKMEDGSRLILVGDVHGMYEPFKDLLDQVKYEHGKDHVVLLGDFISKGEGSIDVLETAMAINASCVRGNHEDQILELYAAHYGLPHPRYQGGGHAYTLNQVEDDEEEEQDNKFQAESSRIRPIDRRIARSLTPEHIEYLSTCPAILNLGNVSDEGYASVAVHAGLQWHIPKLEDQDPWNVMTMRTLLPPDFKIACEDRDGSPWANQWNQHQRHLPADERRVVFYGHDAHQGLNLNEFSKGLDTACVKGRQLTSIIVTANGNGNYTNELFSVSCASKSK